MRVWYREVPEKIRLRNDRLIYGEWNAFAFHSFYENEVKPLKKIKKLIAIIVSAMLLLLSCLFSISVSAAEVGYGNMFFVVENETYTATLSTYEGNDENLVIPEEVYGYTVTSIAPRVFYENTTLKSVSIPDTVTTIGLYAFAFCSSLQSVSLGENITTLGQSVFFSCTSLESAAVNCNINTLPSGTFQNCSALSNVTLSDSINAIDSTAFMGCSELGDLPLENITSYGSNCFLGTAVSEAVIADGVAAIPWMCFAKCNQLTTVTIPESVTSINETAFYEIMDNITIKCCEGSAAYEFAVENDIPYILITKYLLGDVDGSGDVNISDVTEIQRHLAELVRLEGIFLYAADTNQDGIVAVSDATAVQMYLAEYDIPYPIKEVITQ